MSLKKKWTLKVVLGGLLGACGMLIAHGFPYGLSGLNYHVPPIQYFQPWLIGVLIGLAPGFIEKNHRKIYGVSFLAGMSSVIGTYLWRQVYESGCLGEGVAIVGPFLVIVFIASFVSAGVGIGQLIFASKQQLVWKSILTLVLRVACCTSLCFLFSGYLFTNHIVKTMIFGFVLGGSSYLIGEMYD